MVNLLETMAVAAVAFEIEGVLCLLTPVELLAFVLHQRLTKRPPYFSLILFTFPFVSFTLSGNYGCNTESPSENVVTAVGERFLIQFDIATTA